MLNLIFEKMHPNAVLPHKTHISDGAFDLTATEVIKEEPYQILVKTGLCCEILEGWRLRIAPRSSFTKHSWVLNNSDAIIDSSYRGELMFRFQGIPIGINTLDMLNTLIYETFPYKPGDRFSQLYEQKVEPVTCQWGKINKNTKRGDKGFGSTG